MAHFYFDNVHTTAFTPRDYQVELLAASKEKNIIACLGHNTSKDFIALKLIQESAHELRGIHCNNKNAIYICNGTTGESTYNSIFHLTDLVVINLNKLHKNEYNWSTILSMNHVIILNVHICLEALIDGNLDLSTINLIIIEDCHKKLNKSSTELNLIFEYYLKCKDKPKVLGLAGPLYSAACPAGRLAAELECLEKIIQSETETASDIVTLLRYCAKPTEIILQCAPQTETELSKYLCELILTKKTFIVEHRFDPTEIYDDSFQDELKNIPDPKKEPLELINEFLDVLIELGPWCADRVALNLIMKIEKLKIKTPYERHFLLLCMLTTAFVQIRKYCEYTFHQYPTEKERIERFSSPKVLRMFDILRLFKPKPKTDCIDANNRVEKKHISDIDSLDFNGLNLKISNLQNDVVKMDEAKNQSIINSRSFMEAMLFKPKPSLYVPIDLTISTTSTTTVTTITTANVALPPSSTSASSSLTITQPITSLNHNSETTATYQSPIKQRNRSRFQRQPRFINNRNRVHNQNDPDALYGIIFCNKNSIAKILHNLLYFMSKQDKDLSYLCVQFTVDRLANPITEVKEAENEHRKQEEVLKRFRMHECNLLIGTSVLEEGIDLPKCNLVIRWDPPKTYRSYVQCKGRARATNAYHIIMVAPKVEGHFSKNKQIQSISKRSHRLTCPPGRKFLDKTDNVVITDKMNEKKVVEQINDGSSKSLTENTIHNDVIINTNCTIDGKTEPKHEDDDDDNDDDDDVNDDNTEETNKAASLDIMKYNLLVNYKCVNEDSDADDDDDDYDDDDDDDDDDDYDNDVENDNGKTVCNKKDERNYLKNLNNMKVCTKEMVERLAQYMEIEKMLLQKCHNTEPMQKELQLADKYTMCIQSYNPLLNEDSPSVNLSTAIALVNKYCAKLPSDTFSKLTPLWRYAKTLRNGREWFQYTVRLPINSPVKEDILGLPMKTRILARRCAALITCRVLHLSGELDDTLQPIGKEAFRASEPDWENFALEKNDEEIVFDNTEPRPGTTKRRQYYCKKIASVFSNCRPTVNTTAYLYYIKLKLECPIPEEQNTRGRKVYPPEDALQGFGILTLKKIPKLSAFAIFTRSGEVRVSLELSQYQVTLNELQLNHINIFLNYTFKNVLRLQKYFMLFDPDANENSFLIVPTIKRNNMNNNNNNNNNAINDDIIEVDWNFLNLIANNSNKLPETVSDEERQSRAFDINKFKDAVVMPWYRNQDKPQYFYVAEICYHLTPASSFPGENYTTFQEYYFRKYGISIQNLKQPLLDVDHTSARLNFLTPRYVNRKGVALPTSSEETKRAKRENLEQKQILVPELCTIHLFPASLWRTAVCLPCILYRINALLLADEIRIQVANELGLGKVNINEDNFQWPILDFGWTLAEVLKKSREKLLKQQQQQSSQQLQEPLSKIVNDSDNNKNKNAYKNNNGSNKDKSNNECENEKLIEENSIKTANDILDEADEKLKGDCLLEIGTWSNDMANNIYDQNYFNDSDWGLLPPNINMCSRAKTQIRYGSPTSWDNNNNNTNNNTKYNKNNNNSMNDNNYYTDSDETYDSDDEFDDNNSIVSNTDRNNILKIEFKSDNVAEAIESEAEILKRERQLEIINRINATENTNQITNNLDNGYDGFVINDTQENVKQHEHEYFTSIEKFKNKVYNSGMLITYDKEINLNCIKQINIENKNNDNYTNYNGNNNNNCIDDNDDATDVDDNDDKHENDNNDNNLDKLYDLVSYIDKITFKNYIRNNTDRIKSSNEISLNLNDLYELNSIYFKQNNKTFENYRIEGIGDLFDNFNDMPNTKLNKFNGKQLTINESDFYKNKMLNKTKEKICIVKPSLSVASSITITTTTTTTTTTTATNHNNNVNNDDHLHDDGAQSTTETIKQFSFDLQPNLDNHYGPCPSIILQALTMSNANDGINLERLETIGDSFLKYAITTYLYCTYENVHEGKLSHLRSKQVSNLNLYRLGRRKMLGESMIATKFEPHDNWLPPCYYVPKDLEKTLHESKIPACHWNLSDLKNIKEMTTEEICHAIKVRAKLFGLYNEENDDDNDDVPATDVTDSNNENFPCFIPYNLVTQHSIPDKSVADCVEALIGAYLIECGPRGALLFMAWLGIRVLPCIEIQYNVNNNKRIVGSTQPFTKNDIKDNCNNNNNNIHESEINKKQIIYGEWASPKSPLIQNASNPYDELELLLDGYCTFEDEIGYHFNDRSYLLQAMTHASYSPNRLTDCYQRLEFLGDAVLDYLITRHLYEDPRQHSPGALTDLRSALVNNTIFASLAVRHGFHRYFRHLSPGLNDVIDRFVRIQHENGHSISEEFYLRTEDECDEAEDVEVPKALGDVFESIAGAIFLDSNMSLDMVWKIYSNIMKPEIEQFSNSVPKSPIRELLELEPETAKFSKPEKLADGRRVRVTVEVFGKGIYRGIGRNYRIAKCTAAKCALRQLKKRGLISKKH